MANPVKLTAWVGVGGVAPGTNARFLHGLRINNEAVSPREVVAGGDMVMNDQAVLSQASSIFFGVVAPGVLWDTLYIYVATGVDTSTGHMACFRDAAGSEANSPAF